MYVKKYGDILRSSSRTINVSLFAETLLMPWSIELAKPGFYHCSMYLLILENFSIECNIS